jgi:hypothetical protein
VATWIIERQEGRGNNKVRVYYHNHHTDEKHELGRLASDVPDTLVVDWIFTHGGITAGEKIRLSDGYILAFLGREAAAA